ncbi:MULTISPECIES: GtrA family protein [unclassified Nocardioides]|uniref:GtrA family protein n=1 Tax=unclassified Nocardioides TaxID=2615069 RepID=UPI0000EB6177|nr:MULTISPECIES: GtrA family protein [unclassified Nocardioides]ABL81111.1 GtrA family protein [Nocardioides sp. JS614]
MVTTEDLPRIARTPLLGPRLAELVTFLGVGGVAYVVDVVVFNILLSTPPFSTWHPWAARCLAVAVAMLVTYVGNRQITWRGRFGADRHRKITLFVGFNLVGLAISVACLVVSHDVLGLTSRLADNISANVVGLVLGTAFRFWSYRRFVFTDPNV